MNRKKYNCLLWYKRLYQLFYNNSNPSWSFIVLYKQYAKLLTIALILYEVATEVYMMLLYIMLLHSIKLKCLNPTNPSPSIGTHPWLFFAL